MRENDESGKSIFISRALICFCTCLLEGLRETREEEMWLKLKLVLEAPA